jgi:hypothetical protein
MGAQRSSNKYLAGDYLAGLRCTHQVKELRPLLLNTSMLYLELLFLEGLPSYLSRTSSFVLKDSTLQGKPVLKDSTLHGKPVLKDSTLHG